MATIAPFDISARPGVGTEYIVTCCGRLILNKIRHICFCVRCAADLLIDTARAFKTIRPDPGRVGY